MTWPARLRSWFRAALARPDLNRDIREELEFHIDQYARDLRRRGLPAAEADRRARAELGGFGGRLEDCRQALGLRLVDEVRGDVRYTLRLLRRSPVFTTVAVLSLGLGIGANTAIFSLVDAVLLKSVPVVEPSRLFFVDDSGGKSEGSNGPPYPCYETLRDRSRYFSGLAMFAQQRFRVTVDGADEWVRGQYASGNYFDVLGVPAAYGRTLTPADDRLGAIGPDGPVVVISHALWKRRFSMSPSALGARILVGETPMTIVGVMPPEFFGLTVGAPVDLTVPVTRSPANLSTRRSWWFSVVGRLAGGATVDNARAELDGMFQTYMTDLGITGEGRQYFDRIELVPAGRGLNDIRRQFSTPLAIVMTIVVAVLLIGCANVANLLLARGSMRQHEMALRLAIGAGRGRLVRQLLTEGLVLSLLGASAGLLLAHWSTALLVRMIGTTREQIVLDPRLDARVLTVAMTAGVLTGVLCSLIPALRTTGAAGAHAAGGGRVSPSRSRRLSQQLVVVQVTLSLVLLCGAALFVRTLENLEHVDAGFRRDRVLVMPVETALPKLAPGSDGRAELARMAGTWDELAAHAGRVPGVRSAGVTTLSPLGGRDRGVNLSVTGGAPIPERDRSIHLNLVTPASFDVFGIRLLAGRFFDRSDTAKSGRTAVLSQSAARAFFDGASPLGRFVTVNASTDRYEVVGVVGDARFENLRTEGGRMLYLPMSQAGDLLGRGLFDAFLAVKGDRDPIALAAPLREEIRRASPRGFVTSVATLEQQVESSLLQERLISMLATVFGGLALSLACIGLYGLLSYTVVRRTREFGIRLAVGAPRASVIWMVLRDTLRIVAAGLACGVLIVAAAGRYLTSVLFGVTSNDPVSIGAAVSILLGIAITAAYLPARRAGRINPTTALREE